MTQEQIQAAINISHILEGIGVDEDIALHQGFQLVGKFANVEYRAEYERADRKFQAQREFAGTMATLRP